MSFTSGGAAGHNVLSTTHSDAFATDTPADGDVLTYSVANSRWEAAAPTGGSGSGGYEDRALWHAYTLDKNPNASFPDLNIIRNGTAAKGLLTSEGFPYSEEQGFTSGYAGWRRGTELASDGILTITFDFTSAVTIGVGRIAGYYETSQQIHHPEALDVEFSDDNSAWTTFGTSLSGMGTNPGSETPAVWVLEISATAVSHRYWRFRIEGGTAGNDDWLFIGRVHLLGNR